MHRYRSSLSYISVHDTDEAIVPSGHDRVDAFAEAHAKNEGGGRDNLTSIGMDDVTFSELRATRLFFIFSLL